MGIKIKLVHTEADPVRFAFLHLFEKRPGMKNADGTKGKDKFEATAILKPNGANASLVQDTIVDVLKQSLGEELVDVIDRDGERTGEKLPAWQYFLKHEADDEQKGLRKGNLKRNAAQEVYSGFEDMVYITAKNEVRPGVFIPGPNGQPVPATVSDGKPYAGCHGHMEVEVWLLNKPGVKKRVVMDLCGCMFAKDGDAFGGGATPSNANSFAGLSVADAGDGDAPKGGLFD